MKAIRVHAPGGPEVLRYEDVPEPQPKPGEAVVRVEAAGLNFIDVYNRTGLYKVELPITLGREGAGTVLSVAADVKGVAAGDRVAWAGVVGAYAEQAAVPAERLVKLPDGVDTRHGAAAMLQGMTAHYLACTVYPLKPGDACLVHAAAGGVGLLLTQIAKMRGARVIGTVSTEEKAKLAREAGADETIDYTRQDFVAEVKRWTSGAGVQAVYDSVGKTTFEKGFACLAQRGMMALFGQSSGTVGPFDLQLLAGGLPLPDAADALPVHRDARGARRARRRRAVLDPGRPAQVADRPGVPALGDRRGAPRPRGPTDDRQGPAHPLTGPPGRM